MTQFVIELGLGAPAEKVIKVEYTDTEFIWTSTCDDESNRPLTLAAKRTQNKQQQK